MKRLAIVGYGGIAPKHMEVFRALGCEIVASVNKSPQRREQARLEGGIPATYAALDEMLDRERPDGVICCPTFDQIFPVAKALAPRRIPALLEKPTGVSLAEFNELCALVAEHRAPQMVGLNRRHYSVVNRAVADAGGPAAVRAVLIDWSEDPAHLRRKGFSDAQISRWVFSNSIHGLDLLTTLAGSVATPQILATHGAGALDWYMSLSGV
ncbi:MAG TPA: Gfo/Idh/MocA family oxidoreductase, partial [Pirellulales bacterium]